MMDLTGVMGLILIRAQGRGKLVSVAAVLATSARRGAFAAAHAKEVVEDLSAEEDLTRVGEEQSQDGHDGGRQTTHI